jgi:hypothetical protein
MKRAESSGLRQSSSSVAVRSPWTDAIESEENNGLVVGISSMG